MVVVAVVKENPPPGSRLRARRLVRCGEVVVVDGG